MVSIPEKMINSYDGRIPIPMIGMGMAAFTEGHEKVKVGAIEAMKVGYRHFDTTAVYGTEEALGEAIREALKLGVIKSRAELFITTKLWCNCAEGHLVLPAIKRSLLKLGLEYVDLYLIHWPLLFKQDEFKLPIPIECVFPINIKEVWKAMEECRNLGLTKSIGVSNFSSRKIQEIISFAKIPPAVNQVEMNPTWQQKKLIEFCKANDILVSAYSPLGAIGNTWGHNRVMECEVLKDIATSKGRTLAQLPWFETLSIPSISTSSHLKLEISLRWIHEQGVSCIVRSSNVERMKQNLEIFNWSLTEEELSKISKISQQKEIYILGHMVAEPNNVTDEIDADLSSE